MRHHLGEYDRDRLLPHRRHQPRELRGHDQGLEGLAPEGEEAAPEEQGKRGQQRREQQRKRGRKGYKSQQEAEKIRQSVTVEGLMRRRLCRIRNSKDRRQDLAGEDFWPREEPLLVATGLKG